MAMPSNQVLLEKINNVASEISEIKSELKDFSKRVLIIENWKLVFVTKFGIYSAVAIFLGSIIGTAISSILVIYFKKYLGL